MPAEGGEPKRLTWHPGNDFVQGWTPDGKAIMFSSSRASWAPSGAPRFWTVPAEGGVEQPMALPRGYQGKISSDGTRIAYRMNNSWDEERRNYRGGQNRPIWIVDLKTYDLVSPPWTDSKDVDPVWLGDTVYFLSDRDGVANVWSYDTRSKKLAQVTSFVDFDVKSIDAGAGAIVFEQAGDVHELDPKSGKARVVTITAAGDFPWMMPRWEDVTARMANLSLSPTGKRILAEARGEIFTIPAEKGDVRNISHSSGSAERDPAWSPDGKYISYFSDKSGEYKLVIEEQDGLKPPREIALEKPTHYYTPAWSPDSTKILFTDTNLHVWVLDVASGKAKIVGNDPWMVPQRTLNPVWSPDSKWVAYREPAEVALSRDLHQQRRHRRNQAGHRRSGRLRVAGVGRERQVSLVPRVDRFRIAVAVARHDIVRPRGELRAVLRRAEEERSQPAAARERRGSRRR